jgi:hypothetical protein
MLGIQNGCTGRRKILKPKRRGKVWNKYIIDEIYLVWSTIRVNEENCGNEN